MAQLKIEDSTFSLELTSDTACPILNGVTIEIVRAIHAMHAILPMSSYTITRDGATDVWNITAIAQDARAYATTLTLAGGEWRYTSTSLSQGTTREVSAFLDVAEWFAHILKSVDVTLVELTWVV